MGILLQSKASLIMFGILVVGHAVPLSALSSKPCQTGWLCFCLAGYLLLSHAAFRLHLLHIAEYFHLQDPTETPWSSTDQGPAAPYTLPTNNPAGASFGRGKKASQHLRSYTEMVQGHWCKTQVSSGGCRCLPKLLQLRCSWVWFLSSAYRETQKCWWEVVTAGEEVDFSCFTLHFFLCCSERNVGSAYKELGLDQSLFKEKPKIPGKDFFFFCLFFCRIYSLKGEAEFQLQVYYRGRNRL